MQNRNCVKDQISKFLQERIDAGDFPSAVYLVAEKGEIVMHDALGFAVVEPERIEARLDTIYDLASLTKVLVTGLLAARLVDQARVQLTDSVSIYVPSFNSNEKREITVKNLAVHNSGMMGWLPLYLFAASRLDVLNEVSNRPLEYGIGTRIVYSDLNFIVLANIIEQEEFGRRIDLIASERIFDVLQLKATDFNPIVNDYGKIGGISSKHKIAASEKGNAFEKQTCIEQGYLQPPATAGGSDMNPVASHHPVCETQPPLLRQEGSKSPGSDPIRNPQSAFRDYQIWGEVHDGNAYFMGGVAGHAGLFSTAEEVFKIAQQFLPNYSKLLKPETCELFRTNFTPGMNEHRSFAFQLASTPDSTAGKLMSPQSFGHLGFTGTSLWIDPVKERIFILLTNRTHNHALPFVNINSVRRRFHDLAIGQLE